VPGRAFAAGAPLAAGAGAGFAACAGPAAGAGTGRRARALVRSDVTGVKARITSLAMAFLSCICLSCSAHNRSMIADKRLPTFTVSAPLALAKTRPR
jgi:hypothetical protein